MKHDMQNKARAYFIVSVDVVDEASPSRSRLVEVTQRNTEVVFLSPIFLVVIGQPRSGNGLGNVADAVGIEAKDAIGDFSCDA